MLANDLIPKPTEPLDEKSAESLQFLANILASMETYTLSAPTAEEIFEALSEPRHLVIDRPFLSFELSMETFWQFITMPSNDGLERFITLQPHERIEQRESVCGCRPSIGLNLYALVENPFTQEARLNYERLNYYAILAEQIGRRLVKLTCHQLKARLSEEELSSFEKDYLNQTLAVLGKPNPFTISPIGLADMLAALGKSYASEEARELSCEIMTEICSAWGYSAESASQTLNFCRTTHISRVAHVADGVRPLLCPGFFNKKTSQYVVHAPLRTWAEVTQQNLPENNTAEEWFELLQRSPYAYDESAEVDTLQRFPMQTALQDFTAYPLMLPFEFATSADVAKALPKLSEEAKKQGCQYVAWYITSIDKSCSLYESQEDHNEDLVVERRPPVLECDVVRFQNDKEKWVAFVGLLNGRPYEIFTGLQDDDEGIVLPKSVMKGHIIRANNSDGTRRYDFQFVNKRGYKTTVEGLSGKFNKEFWNYAKLISGVLRYRMPIETVIKLVGSMSMEDETINTWKTGVARALKKYVSGGSEV
ncbi:MAG: hypothetical protein IJ816_05300 [Alloprevotella sp.]|nr:hypothetical protein [Alloprevotella sp.]